MYDNMEKMFEFFKNQNYESEPDSYSSEEEEEEEDLPNVNPAFSFGLNVNEPVNSSANKEAPAHTGVPGAAPSLASTAPVAPPLPDASLPLATARPPKNWDPDPSVMSWACASLEVCEWTKEDRKVISEKFSPDPAYDHIFTAVSHPPELLAAIRSPELLDKDFLFKRAETEQFLFSANEDLASGLRPLLEVISSLKDKDMEGTRLNIAYVFQSMASACCHLSRGRRELGRRFVPIESANVLFKNKPSHYCIFGFDSIKAATDNSAEVKNVNKELVHVQKKRKFFRTSQ